VETTLGERDPNGCENSIANFFKEVDSAGLPHR
ncbi:hypothetical protein AVEN_228074-2-1, partial [Araneus ventricosus]